MEQSFSTLLAVWSNFYVMTGTSAAGLTGLMFVVITLVTGAEKARSQDGISTFSTPTVMHFGAALFVSAILIAPLHSVAIAATLVGFAGLYGVVYILRVTYRAKRLKGYRPDIEDWIWYNALPFLAYGAILAGAIALHAVPGKALLAVAGGVLLLIFIGIRNAWDVVTFLATGGPESL
jgi:hypothetical protein